MRHLVICSMLSAVSLSAQQVDPSICPLHKEPAGHAAGMDHSAHAAMESRGAKAMGFDQSRASHHFKLAPDGGRIEIHVNRRDDEEVRDQVATHLKAIAGKFARGDFAIPQATHGGVPDGVEEMRRFRNDIQYRFEPTQVGGAVSISSQQPEAIEAIHQFLRYQIREHKTGDPLVVAR